MKNFVLALAFALCSASAIAQFQLSITTENQSEEIGDAVCTVSTTGGVAPFEYQWSKKDISLASNVCLGMQEGMRE